MHGEKNRLTSLVELDEELENILRDLGERLLSSDLLLKGSSGGSGLVLEVGRSSREVGEGFLTCKIDKEMQGDRSV